MWTGEGRVTVVEGGMLFVHRQPTKLERIIVYTQYIYIVQVVGRGSVRYTVR